MRSVTDFEGWISACDLTDYEDQYCLYQAVKQVDRYGCFECEKIARGGYNVRCSGIDDTLILDSEKARDYFLKTVEKRYAEGMTMDAYYAYRQAMSKND